MDVIRHGGDIYHHDVELDFSVNENPFGMPEGVRRALLGAVENCRHYPDPRAEELRTALSEKTGIPRENLLCGNGASELFTAIVRAVNPKRTLLPVPSFLGYEHALQACEGEIVYYNLREEKGFRLDEEIYPALANIDLLFLAHPSNPVGNLADADFLEKLLEHCRAQGIYVVLDECFIELCPGGAEASFLTRVEAYPNLLVVRAFTKTYGIPGVRLGYLACDRNLIDRVKRQIPEWNISVFAQAAGVAALQAEDYLSESVQEIQTLRQELVGQLEESGFTVYDGCCNFIFFKSELPLYEALLERKILIRDCANYRGLQRGYYRIAVRRREENDRLIRAIKEIQENAGICIAGTN